MKMHGEYKVWTCQPCINLYYFNSICKKSNTSITSMIKTLKTNVFQLTRAKALIFDALWVYKNSHRLELKAAMWVQATWCSHFRRRFRCERIGTQRFLRLDLSHAKPSFGSGFVVYSVSSYFFLQCFASKWGLVLCTILALAFLHFLQRQSLSVLFELLLDLGGDLVQVKWSAQGPFMTFPSDSRTWTRHLCLVRGCFCPHCSFFEA